MKITLFGGFGADSIHDYLEHVRRQADALANTLRRGNAGEEEIRSKVVEACSQKPININFSERKVVPDSKYISSDGRKMVKCVQDVSYSGDTDILQRCPVDSFGSQKQLHGKAMTVDLDVHRKTIRTFFDAEDNSEDKEKRGRESIGEGYYENMAAINEAIKRFNDSLTKYPAK